MISGKGVFQIFDNYLILSLVMSGGSSCINFGLIASVLMSEI